MNKIKKFINKLKKQKIRYEKLSECTNLTVGKRITKSMMDDKYDYPVMGGGVVPTGRYLNYNYEKSVTISRAGSAGFVNWLEGKFWATSDCFVASQKQNGPLIKYVYYYLKNKQKEFRKHLYGGSLPKLNKEYLWELPIPVPPIEVQSEIVKILDNFTELTAELTAELTTELTARNKQYEYYRDKLLSFKNFCGAIHNQKDIVCYKKLREIVSVNRGKRLTKSQLSNDYEYEVYHGSKDSILGKYFDFNVPEGTVIVVNTGSIGGVKYLDEKAWCSDGCFWLGKNKKVLLKFIYYYLATKEDFLISKIRVGGVPTIDKSVVENLEIPIPPLKTQEKVVYVLDNFDKICKDLNIGLPRELVLRNKQYEYYRDLILRFPETSGGGIV